MDAIQSGLYGMRQGFERLDRGAARIAGALPRAAGPAAAPAGPAAAITRDEALGGIADALVELMLARHQVALGAAVVDRAAETQGSLIDILA
jgi:hypothetical protein